MTDVNAGGAPQGAQPDNAVSGAGAAPDAGAGEQLAFDWGKAGLDELSLGYVQSKGWDGPKSLVESYRNAEKLLGVPADQIVRLPKDRDPSLMGEVYDKLGRPKSPDGYSIPMPQAGGDEALAKAVAPIFHEAGLTQAQVEKVVGWWNETAGKAVEAQQAELAQRDEQQLADLKREWGPQGQANAVLVDRAAEKLGLTTDHLQALKQALGPGETMKFLHNIGSRIGVDDAFIDGGHGGGSFGGMSPAQAKAEIAELQRDSGFVRRFAAGDVDARRQMARLNQLAYPEN